MGIKDKLTDAMNDGSMLTFGLTGLLAIAAEVSQRRGSMGSASRGKATWYWLWESEDTLYPGYNSGSYTGTKSEALKQARREWGHHWELTIDEASFKREGTGSDAERTSHLPRSLWPPTRASTRQPVPEYAPGYDEYGFRHKKPTYK